MTRFFKLSGGGNDFLALVEPDEAPSRSLVSAWCRRGTSEGADGLFLLDRSDDGVRMRHFNSDGGRAPLCLNGTRCAARLAFELGWADQTTEVHTDAGSFAAARASADRIELQMAAPTEAIQHLSLPLEDQVWEGSFLVVGVPHLVVAWEKPMSEAPVDRVGPELRSHPLLPQGGANVDFVRFPEPGQMEIRSFERGVEGETLACGTGVVAAVRVAVAAGWARLPLEALTLGGFRIGIAAAESEGSWRMTGDARLIAQGELESAAATTPEAPSWR